MFKYLIGVSGKKFKMYITSREPNLARTPMYRFIFKENFHYSFVGYETLDQMNKSLHRNLVSVRTLCQRERKTIPVLARFECLLTKYIWCGYTQLRELLIYSYSLYLTIRIFYPQIKSNRFYFNSPIFLKKQLKVELIKNTYLESVEQVQLNKRLAPFRNKCTFHFSSIIKRISFS